jgi:hypothetical protein
MRKHKSLTAFVFSLAMLCLVSACGDKSLATADRLEEARQTAKANSEFNAQIYKAANPRFTADFSIISRSDDTQDAKCPQGDGWADLSIMRVQGKDVDKTQLVCSTYSASVGCYRKEDFEKTPNLAKQNGSCSKDVPYPLPVLKR